MAPHANPLPYRDIKAVGAADFYFAINATFRFILGKFGIEGLRRYWMELGARYFAPVTKQWEVGGIPAVAAYWRAFFAAEPGGEVEVTEGRSSVVLQVKKCPAIAHLREHGREIMPCFCQHCYFISESMGKPAGVTVRIRGGNGSCRQEFVRNEAATAPQELADIKEVTSC